MTGRQDCLGGLHVLRAIGFSILLIVCLYDIYFGGQACPGSGGHGGPGWETDLSP